MIINLSRDDAAVVIDALTHQARAYDEMEYADGAIATYRIRRTLRRLARNDARREKGSGRRGSGRRGSGII